jgi:hypothetical protein
MPGKTAEDYIARVPQLKPPHCPEILNETLSLKLLISGTWKAERTKLAMYSDIPSFVSWGKNHFARSALRLRDTVIMEILTVRKNNSGLL